MEWSVHFPTLEEANAFYEIEKHVLTEDDLIFLADRERNDRLDYLEIYGPTVVYCPPLNDSIPY